MQFGEWVAVTRQQKGLTQRECAIRADMSPQRWSQLERHGRNVPITHPTHTTLERVAHALDVPLPEAQEAAERSRPSGNDLALPFHAIYNSLPDRVRMDVDEMVSALHRRHHEDERHVPAA